MPKRITGLVDALRKRELAAAQLVPVDLLAWHRHQTLYQRDVKGHKGCVNALEFSRDENLFLSGGDDCQVWLWSASHLIGKKNPKPRRIMQGQHQANIFTLGFSPDGREAFSAGNDGLFMAHDVESGTTKYSLESNRAIHRLDSHPFLNGVVSVASEDGCIYIVDTRTKQENKHDLKQKLYSAMYNPREPDLLCVAMHRNGVHVYDTRSMNEPYVKITPTPTMCTYARWSPSGEGIAAVVGSHGGITYYRCLEPTSTTLTDPEYLNACTMKSCAFVDEETILCGSDHWDIYAWKLPSSSKVEKVDHCYTKLEGHRSIVNHIRYSAKNNVIVSSGVEKIIKCWSCYEMEGSVRDPARRDITNPHIIRHFGYTDGPEGSVEEDFHTLHQFDHYVRRASNARQMFGDRLFEDSDDETVHDMQNLFEVALLQFDTIEQELELEDSDEDESANEAWSTSDDSLRIDGNQESSSSSDSEPCANEDEERNSGNS